MNSVIWQSNSDEWSTPQELFNRLDAEFHFDLDPCATHENAKCQKYFTAQENGLEKSWGGVQSVLQSTLFRDRYMGAEVLRRIAKAEYGGGASYSFQNRYKMVS